MSTVRTPSASAPAGMQPGGHSRRKVPASQCGVFYASELSLTDAWTEYSIPWTSLARDFQGGAAVGPDQLLLLQFEAPAPDAFDFWIDDVSFF